MRLLLILRHIWPMLSPDTCRKIARAALIRSLHDFQPNPRR